MIVHSDTASNQINVVQEILVFEKKEVTVRIAVKALFKYKDILRDYPTSPSPPRLITPFKLAQ